MKISLLLALSALGAGDNQIVVPTFATSGVDPSVAPIVTELVLEALLNRHGVRALGPADIKDLLTTEQQRQLVGCEQSSCMSELAGALGARNMVSGLVGKLGDTFVVTLKLVDTETAKVGARASRRFAALDRAPDAVGPLVDDLLGQRPRVESATPQVLVEKPAAPRASAMPTRVFCDEALAGHTRTLERARYDSSLVARRKKLLEDLLATAFREELVAKLLFLLQSPIRGLATVLAANIRNLAVVIDQIAKQKETA